MTDFNVFVEQAEYIDSESFQEWSIQHPDEDLIVRKLSRGGAKLIIGPRGCGKTTLMLKTFHKILGNKRSTAFPIYVNFKSSLKLEPLYKQKSNAVFWFNQWLLFKIYQGIFEAIDNLNLSDDVLNKIRNKIKFSKDEISNTTHYLELGNIEVLEHREIRLTYNDVENDVRLILNQLDKSRCILLLDDAAHAFSAEQQKDFFEFFRQMKSRYISPKAAIYPGVTMYPSTFHAGHDAEEIYVWIKPDSKNYLQFMHDLLERRFPKEIFQQLSKDKQLLNMLCFAAFGIPRALLNMIQSFIKVDPVSDAAQMQKFDRRSGLKAISDCYKSTYKIFDSLKDKLPIYKQFIYTGNDLFENMITAVKNFNKSKSIDRQSVTIAIAQPLPAELSRVLGFFQYCGLLLPKAPVSRGVKGVFELYVIHYAALTDKNAIFAKKAININNYSEAFLKRNAHEFTRVSIKTLFGSSDLSDKFPISLPPCHVCRTPRVNEHTKFCTNCGAQLRTASIFETLVSKDIGKLALTQHRVRTIKKYSNIRTIKDILIDHDYKELRSVPQIGPIWSNRIFRYAEEFIA